MPEPESNPTPEDVPEGDREVGGEVPVDAPRDSLDELWERVCVRWDDDPVHAAFLEHARALGRLPEAARRYRAHAAQAAGDDADEVRARVQERLATITAMAIAELHTSRAPTQTHRWWRGATVVVALALFIAATMLLLRALGG